MVMVIMVVVPKFIQYSRRDRIQGDRADSNSLGAILTKVY
jgi:hypothetical protein